MEEGQLSPTPLWLSQPRPGPRHREKWQHFLDQFCIVPSLNMTHPLGKWLGASPRRWNAYYDAQLHTVLIKNGNQWQHYGLIIKGRRHWTIDTNQPSIDNTPPHQLSHLHPLDVIRKTSNKYIMSIPVYETQVSPSPTPITWTKYVDNLPQWDKSILKDIMNEQYSIWHELLKDNQEWDIIGDGSYLAPNASYAWIIHNKTKVIYLGHGNIPGKPSSAFRSELAAVMTWHCFLYHVLQYYDIPSTITITPFTDNAKVIKYYNLIQQKQSIHSPYMDDYDIYIMLQYYYNQLSKRGIHIKPITKLPKYKKDNPPENDLHIQLHQQVDAIARNHRQTGVTPSYNPPPQDYVHLRDFNGVITSQEKQVLETNWTTYELETYYIQRWQTTATTITQFDWNIYTKNYDRARPTQQTYILKMMTGWLPVFHHLNKMETRKGIAHIVTKRKQSHICFNVPIANNGGNNSSNY